MLKSFLARAARGFFAFPVFLSGLVVAYASPPTSASGFISDTKNMVSGLMGDVYILIFSVGGLTLAVIGFMWHAASDDTEAAKHKRRFSRAVIGIIIALGASAVISIIKAAYGG